jgi:hypothetical protein
MRVNEEGLITGHASILSAAEPRQYPPPG